jgi:hypothetical protein
MSGQIRKKAMRCDAAARWLMLYLYDELAACERELLEAHLAECPDCRQALERARILLRQVATYSRPEPDSRLLEQCRSRLGETLDELARTPSWRRWLSGLHPFSWLASHPAMGTALLILLGVVVGYGVPRWLEQASEGSLAAAPVITVHPQPSEAELMNAQVQGIHWIGSGADGDLRVEIQLAAERPLLLQGDPADDRVKFVLMRVARGYEWADPSLRMDSLNVLATKNGDAEVRRTLCEVARKDHNPAVRLKALEALRGAEQDERVRQTLLELLLQDENPGVRVEAINGLRALVERSGENVDARLIEVFRDRMHRDPNTYIRMQSAAAIRDLTPREVY